MDTEKRMAEIDALNDGGNDVFLYAKMSKKKFFKKKKKKKKRPIIADLR
jgi:hypothetical protein